jgi:hypothetical protein
MLGKFIQDVGNILSSLGYIHGSLGNILVQKFHIVLVVGQSRVIGAAVD